MFTFDLCEDYEISGFYGFYCSDEFFDDFSLGAKIPTGVSEEGKDDTKAV